MDAQSKKKAMSGVLAAVMMFAVFASLATVFTPTAQAAPLSGQAGVVVSTDSLLSYSGAYKTTTEGKFNTTVNIRVANLSNAQGDTYAWYLNGAGTALTSTGQYLGEVTLSPANGYGYGYAYFQGGAGNKVSDRYWSAVKFENPGTWKLCKQTGSNCGSVVQNSDGEVKIEVKPQDLTLELDASTDAGFANKMYHRSGANAFGPVITGFVKLGSTLQGSYLEKNPAADGDLLFTTGLNPGGDVGNVVVEVKGPDGAVVVDGTYTYSYVVSSTGADKGKFTFSHLLPINTLGAGEYNITAKLYINDVVAGEGWKTYTVKPNTATGVKASDGNHPDPVKGFSNRDFVVYRFKDETNTLIPIANCIGTPSAGCNAPNVTVTTPKGTVIQRDWQGQYWVNGKLCGATCEKLLDIKFRTNRTLDNAGVPQDGAGTDYDITIHSATITAATQNQAAKAGIGQCKNSAGTVIDCLAWEHPNLSSGTYQVRVELTTEGTYTNDATGGAAATRKLIKAEYDNKDALYAFTVTAAEATNFAARLDSSDKTYLNAKGGANLADHVKKILVDVYGAAETTFPGFTAGGAVATDYAYVNVTGDVLVPVKLKIGPGLTTSAAGTTDSAQEYSTTGKTKSESYPVYVVPSKGLGTIHVSAWWRGATKSFDFTIGNETLAVKATPATVVAADASTKPKITVFVNETISGGYVSSATIDPFWVGASGCTDIAAISSDIATGQGVGGKFTFEAPACVGTLGIKAYGSVQGSTLYGYSTVSVVPAKTASVKLNVSKATAGVPFELRYNVTDAKGDGIGGAKVGIFTEAQYEKFLKNFAADPTKYAAPGEWGAVITTASASPLPAVATTPAKPTTAQPYVVKGNGTYTAELPVGKYVVFAMKSDNTVSSQGNEARFEVVNATIAFTGPASTSSVPLNISSKYSNNWVDVSVTGANGKGLTGWLYTSSAPQGTNAACTARWAAPACILAPTFVSGNAASKWPGVSNKTLGGNITVWAYLGKGNVTKTESNAALAATPVSAKLHEGFYVYVKDGKAGFYANGTSDGYINWTFKAKDAVGKTLDATTGALATPAAGKDGYSGYYKTASQLTVKGLKVSVDPPKIAWQSYGTFIVTIVDNDDKPVANLKVQLQGSPLSGGKSDNRTTSTAGVAVFTSQLVNSGDIQVWVNDKNSGTKVSVTSGIKVTCTTCPAVAGDTVGLATTIIDPANTPVPAKVVVKGPDGAEVANTTADFLGAAHFTAAKEGTYTITATYLTFEPAAATLIVGPKVVVQPKEAKFELSKLTVEPTKLKTGEQIRASVQICNTGTDKGEATARLLVDGVSVATHKETLTAGECQTVGYQGFALTKAGSHTVSVQLVGGEALAPVTVTVESATTTPTDDGTTKPTTPTQGTTPSGPAPTPGFEALFALAAIGAALLVVRRRK